MIPSFDEAVRDLARREGFSQADHWPVQVKMSGEWSGYSEFTITNQWNEFTVKCGDFQRVYSSDDETRIGDDRYGNVGWSESTKSALAKLWDDLRVVTVDEQLYPQVFGART